MKKFNDWLFEFDMSSTVGMGPVVSAQPGAIPGTTGTTGSGDIGCYLGPYGKTPYATVFDAQEKKAKKERHATTDYSKKNKISTPKSEYGYRSFDILKKIKPNSSGLNPWLDFSDELPKIKTANILSTNVPGLHEVKDFLDLLG
jgi:hypothetical protein